MAKKLKRPERPSHTKIRFRRARTVVTPDDILIYGPQVTSFRAHQDLTEEYSWLIKWAAENNSSFSSIFNSFLPAIAYVVQILVFVDPVSGRRYIRANFGDILLREPHQKET